MNQLEVLRESLGQCDEIILDALLMRNRIVEDIMVYKEANNVPILQPEQEAKQKEWLERRMQEKRHKNEVADVFESITRNSKKIQARKLFNYNIVLIGFMGVISQNPIWILMTAMSCHWQGRNTAVSRIRWMVRLLSEMNMVILSRERLLSERSIRTRWKTILIKMTW